MTDTEQIYKLTIEYDGGRYSGWQKQADARTVQGALQHAAETLVGGPVDIQGNGRTDAGVHALRFTAHLAATASLEPGTLSAELNELLPHDITVLEAKKAGPRFHARHHCVARGYLYQITTRKSAFCRRYTWWIKEPLDLRAMAGAAELMKGMHDFSSFTDRKALKNKSPLVLLEKIQVAKKDDVILIRIVGSHFLWKMVRRMVGVLAAVGLHTLTNEDVGRFLREPVNLSPYTAPAQALFFEQCFYNREETDAFLADDTISPCFF
ncbi:MAG: tRNA pseudouridine(38-40) synthase TruA [Desulfobulbaceae bacterium DB1]|nr:MAG: tRNA pseudouridine(38-40) synthase TruA [Desulfobulbaceae bacterium DB1]